MTAPVVITGVPSIQLLECAAALEKWEVFAPLLHSAAQAHPVAESEIDAAYFRRQIESGLCAVFDCMLDGVTQLILVIQFSHIAGKKVAEVSAVAGEHLLFFKGAYWAPILDWLRANDVEFLDAHVPVHRAAVYQKRFGFGAACAYLRYKLR